MKKNHLRHSSQYNASKKEGKKIVLPESDEVPVSASEKLVREDIQKLNRNTEEIRKLKDLFEKKGK